MSKFFKHINLPLFAIITLIVMLVGLLFSRAVLSITHIVWLFFALAFLKKNQIQFGKELFIWSIAPLFLFWLGALQSLNDLKSYDYLLSLSTYSVAAITIIAIADKSVCNKLMIAWLVICLASVCYPLFHFLMHIQETIDAFGRGQSMVTPMDTDHVRYSLFICSALPIIWKMSQWSKLRKIMLSCLVGVIVLFLSVRTGWVALLILTTVIVFTQTYKNVQSFLIQVAVIFAILGFAYFLFPTIQRKIDYSIYDWKNSKSTTYQSNYSDATRFAINKVSYNIIDKNPNVHVGWVNIPKAIEAEFSIQYSNVKPTYSWPFNQFLFWYIGAGWWGCMAFVVWLLFPVAIGIKQRNTMLVAWQLVVIASCFVESTLNFQYGIFLHAWVTAFLWKKDAA